MQPLILLLLMPCGADVVQPPKLPAPPTIVASPSARDALPSAVPLDRDRFLFLAMPDYEGKLTWDVEGGEYVAIFPVKPGGKYPGIKQGETKPAEHVAPGGKADALMVFGVSKGTVRIAAWGVKDGEACKLAVMTLNVGGAPPPRPDDKPEPTGEGAWVEVIEETGQRNADVIRIVGDKAFWDSLERKGHATRFYDKDSPDTPKGHYLSGDVLPALLVISKGGKVLHRGPLPKTTAEIARIVADATGVK